MRSLPLALLALATALAAAGTARAEDVATEAQTPAAAGDDANVSEETNDAATPDAPPAPPASTPIDAAIFSPRLLVPSLGVSLPTDPRLDLREPRGFLGARTTHLAVGWSLVGTGVLSSVAAGTLAWQASRSDQRASAAPLGTSTRDDRAQQIQERSDKRAMANVLAGAGLAFLATGGVTLLTAPAPRGGPNTRVGAMATPSGGYIGLSGKW